MPPADLVFLCFIPATEEKITLIAAAFHAGNRSVSGAVTAVISGDQNDPGNIDIHETPPV